MIDLALGVVVVVVMMMTGCHGPVVLILIAAATMRPAGWGFGDAGGARTRSVIIRVDPGGGEHPQVGTLAHVNPRKPSRPQLLVRQERHRSREVHEMQTTRHCPPIQIARTIIYRWKRPHRIAPTASTHHLWVSGVGKHPEIRRNLGCRNRSRARLHQVVTASSSTGAVSHLVVVLMLRSPSSQFELHYCLLMLLLPSLPCGALVVLFLLVLLRRRPARR